MKVPADGWDRDEREALEEMPEVLSPAREPLLTQSDQDRLLARIHRTARRDAPVAKRGWLRPVLASAAFVVLAVGAWLAFRMTSPAPPAPTVRPEQTVASAPAPTPFQLPLDKPDVVLSLSALTWRGSTGANQLLTDLKSPLDAFREGDYTRADREFTALESRYPEAIEVFFYAGVSRLFTNDAQRALAALIRAGELADATFAPRVAWYRAIAEQRSGSLAQARARLDELCRGTSERAAPACEAVKQLDAGSGAPKNER